MKVEQYRKKPVIIEAVHWDGTEECLSFVLEFIDFDNLPKVNDENVVGVGIGYTPIMGTLDIPTLEGTMTASPGDYIIKGVEGEFYPCKPSIFEASYEKVDNDGQDS